MTERQRETDTERQRERDRERQTDRDTERQRQRQTLSAVCKCVYVSLMRDSTHCDRALSLSAKL